MNSGPPTLLLTLLLTAAAVAFSGGGASAFIGGPSGKHNITDAAGYPFGGDLCAACHSPHYTMNNRMWTKDKEVRGDRQRDLGPAKAASQDQAAGPGDYPGIYICLDCHGKTAKSPSWTGSAAKASTHSSKEMTAAGYTNRFSFVVQCDECHDPHQQWDGNFVAGTNGYMIRKSIRGRDVVLSARAGAGSMGTNSAPYKAVCEVCHTTTNYHRNTGGPQQHYDGQDCSTCHSHSGGFAGTACDKCHGNPPKTAATLVGGTANPGSPATGAATAGKHAFHALSTAGGAGYACKVCHRGGMGDGEAPDKELDVRFNAFNKYTSGSFDGFTPANGYTFSPNNQTGGTLKCGNTYCHGDFAGGNGSNKPAWDVASTGDCGTCHATAPPGLVGHSVHLTALWGPKAACDDCHGAGASAGRHAGHVDGSVRFKDGNTFGNTNACDGCHGNGAADAKSKWGLTPTWRNSTNWCEKCHDGSSTVKTAAGTGGKSVTAPNVVGNAISYGYDVTGHGKPAAGRNCVDCHVEGKKHIDGDSPTYKASLGNFKAGYRLALSNEVPLLGNYSSSHIGLCFSCHIEAKVVGMPPEGRPSGSHVHKAPVSSDQWYTDFRNMSTAAKGRFEGNYDSTFAPGYDVPTNIHWNHLDDFGSSARSSGKQFDSDHDGTLDSYVTCETCHDPHGTHGPAMVYDSFALRTFSVTVNKDQYPTYRWLGSDSYVTNRCSATGCHFSGNGSGTGGTKYYREPGGLGTTLFGAPTGLAATPLP